ncbi:MAG: iron-containing alcohol dehydrogenase [Candidatus Diapherotrites archaeon]|nr:iron-containing alcohol dehydrogenase [Candidatus Diapherotrites archaeon]
MTKDDFWGYSLKTKIFFGTGSLKKIGEILKSENVKRITIVCGKSIEKTDIIRKLIKNIKKTKTKYVIFNKVEPNPKVTICVEASKIAREFNSEYILGIGGGSALDTAKASAATCTNNVDLEDIIKNNIPLKNEALPIIAIPTTSGTASEINKFSVLTSSAGKKIVLRDEKIIPKFAIIDPMLTVSCPKRTTAAAGLDTISHAIESYWSKKANPLTKLFCIESMKISNKWLEKAYKDGGNIKAREEMSKASLYAGLGFSNTGTTDVHKLSYTLTEKFGLEHGFACAIFLPEYVKFNEKGNNKTLKEIAQAFGERNAKELAKRLMQIMRNVNAPTSLREIGAKEKDVEFIVNEGYSENKRNNPRNITKKQLREIIRKIM